jgi:hypothetical protein
MDPGVESAVEVTRSMLAQDGYDVRLERASPGELHLAIIAGPEACEECLVPKEILSGIIEANLPPEMAGTKVLLTYPTESH